jgi:Na+-translocating ferredoxin:NAD+ oxidoreductase RnfC subunit
MDASQMPHPLIDKVKAAGIVGAGGAGFPAHVKYDTQAEILLANGAECEPLLYKDKELMRLFPNEVKKGMELLADSIGAQRSILGIKAKNSGVIGQFRGLFGGTGIEIFEMGDYYPAGDEYVLVHEATGRLIPYGGYPVHIGCVVSNVETLLNVALADSSVPVTETFVTVAGAVASPMTVKVPVGTKVKDLIELAGGLTVDSAAALAGGAMMGSLMTDFDRPVMKTCGGFIFLPTDHTLIRRRNQTISEIKKIGQSACDQCTYCTEFCPRYLLGYQIEPHKVMRSLGFAGEKDDFWGKYALNCCECNLCSLYACPEDLDPKQACVRSKTNITLRSLQYEPPTGDLAAHPMQAHRKVSIKKLTRKLGLLPYDKPAGFVDVDYKPNEVVIPLSQHIGAAAEPTVSVGNRVSLGDLIGKIPDGAMGANVHASINGVVTAVNSAITIEAK